MDNRMHQQTRAEDYLSLRLRRIVRSLVERENKRKSAPWLVFLCSKQHSLVTKILRIVALITCVAVFLIQVYDRTVYYLTSPINTDVLILKNNDEPYPEMTICHEPIDNTKQLFAELGESENHSTPVTYVLINKKRMFNLEDIWRRMKASDDIVSAKVIGTKERFYQLRNFSSHAWQNENLEDGMLLDLQLSEYGKDLLKRPLQNSRKENLTHSDILLPHGNCATFRKNSTIPTRNNHGKFEIVFKYEDSIFMKNRIDYLFVHENKEYPTSRCEHEPMPGFKNIVRMAIKKYNFEYRKNQPCVSSSEHRKCLRDCFTKYSMKIGGCRFPFQPIEANLPSCRNGNFHRMRMYLSGNVADDCTCTRKCNHRIFDSSTEGVEKFVNQTVYTLEFGTPYITVINERFVYTVVNLLADIGGNSGLWIGLSVLSLFYVLPLKAKKKKKECLFSPTDPLYRIVLKKIRREGKSLNSQPITIKSRSPKSIKSLFLGGISLLFAYAVYNRIDKYFQYPVHSVVDITFLQTIHSASVTICPGDTYLESLQKKFAKQNNISDFCEVKKWQLVDMPQSNASILWTSNNDSVGKIDWTVAKLEYLYDGVCFNAFHNDKPINAQSKNFLTTNHTTVCGQDYMKVFIKPPTGYYDYFLYRYVMYYKKHSISYVLKRIAANEDDKECVNEIDHESCKASCLTRKLWAKINCWLPFMPPSNLSLCTSSISAKHSLQTYQELFVLREGSADCKCLPPCYKDIYETTIEGEPWPHPKVTFGFGTRHNIMETYTKVRVYSVVTLLCDIGCWLGSTLGLCVFGVVDVLLNAANQFKKRSLPREYGVRNKH